MSEKPPDVIYLQWYEQDGGEGVTWCEDKINESDVEYLLRTPATAAAPDLLEALGTLMDCIQYEPPNAMIGAVIPPSAMSNARAAIVKATGGEV